MLMTPFAFAPLPVLRLPVRTVLFMPAPVTTPAASVTVLMSILPAFAAVPDARARRALFVARSVPPARRMSDDAASSAAPVFVPSASMSTMPLIVTVERVPVPAARTTAVFAGAADSARSLTVLPARVPIVTVPPLLASMAALPVASAAMSRLPASLTVISLPTAAMPTTGVVLLTETLRSCPFISMARTFAASLFVMAAWVPEASAAPLVAIVVLSFVKT